MRKTTENVIREALADMFDILAYKVRHGAMSESELRTIFSILRTEGGVQATVKELAEYYHQSEDNVRHVIHRSPMPSPKRKVYYDVESFFDNMPAKWHNHASLPAD